MEDPMMNFEPLSALCNAAPKLKLPALIALVLGVCLTIIICFSVHQYFQTRRTEIQLTPEIWRAAGDYEIKKHGVTAADSSTRQRVP